MALKHFTKFLFGPGPRITRDEAMKVFKRDHFKCQYCGLDGLHVFENWLILTIDHVHPYAHGGSRKMDNLVTACRPCNLIKGRHLFPSREEARKYVLAKRDDWLAQYHEQVKALHARPSH
jgi:5-methylcytosine-specific restriction endonuclease McrA